MAQRRSGRTLALFLGLLAVVVAVVAAIIISTSTAPTVVHARTVIAHTFQSAYQQVSNLISQYTK